jgi:hypothetical protein
MTDLSLADMARIHVAIGDELDAWAHILRKQPRAHSETDVDFRVRILDVEMRTFDEPIHVGDGWYAPPGTYPVRRK